MVSDHPTNAISTWTAEYLGLAVQKFRNQGRLVDDTLLAHISPAQSECIGLFGTITVDIDAELAQLGPTDPYASPAGGWRHLINPCRASARAGRIPWQVDRGVAEWGEPGDVGGVLAPFLLTTAGRVGVSRCERWVEPAVRCRCRSCATTT